MLLLLLSFWLATFELYSFERGRKMAGQTFIICLQNKGSHYLYYFFVYFLAQIKIKRNHPRVRREVRLIKNHLKVVGRIIKMANHHQVIEKKSFDEINQWQLTMSLNNCQKKMVNMYFNSISLLQKIKSIWKLQSKKITWWIYDDGKTDIFLSFFRVKKW